LCIFSAAAAYNSLASKLRAAQDTPVRLKDTQDIPQELHQGTPKDILVSPRDLVLDALQDTQESPRDIIQDTRDTHQDIKDT
jgi:hypothetical protein